MNEFEVELVLRGPGYLREGSDRITRDELIRIKITVPRENAFEIAAVALEHGEENGRYLGELVDDPRFDG